MVANIIKYIIAYLIFVSNQRFRSPNRLAGVYFEDTQIPAQLSGRIGHKKIPQLIAKLTMLTIHVFCNLVPVL